jgi:hypothetical protein
MSFRYGNYCGPGPDLNKKPWPPALTPVDAACKQHDVDYFNCKTNWKSGFPLLGSPCTVPADEKFVNQLKQLLVSGQLDKKDIRAAKIILSYFQVKNRFDKFRNNKSFSPQKESISFKDWLAVNELTQRTYKEIL